MDVFGVERGDKSGVQPGVDLVNDAVGLFLDRLNLMRCARQVRIAGRRSLYQKGRSLANEFRLLMKVFEELLFTWKNSHVVLYLVIRWGVGSILIRTNGKSVLAPSDVPTLCHRLEPSIKRAARPFEGIY